MSPVSGYVTVSARLAAQTTQVASVAKNTKYQAARTESKL